MWYKKIGCIIIASSLFLAGCSDDPNVSNENRGRLAGGLAGAAIANEVSDDDMAPVVGALIGGYAGAEAGRNKDNQNRSEATKVFNSKLAQASTSWVDDSDNTKYTLSVSKPYQSGGKTCRPYTMKKSQNGAASSKNGIACLSTDKKVWTVA